jgi:hypothetical protein
VLRHTMTISGDRQVTLQRLPPRLLGGVWHLRATYSTTPVPRLYTVHVFGTTLRPT